MTAKIESLAARRAREQATRAVADREAPLDRSSEPAAPSQRHCPICGNPRSEAHRSFCSRRCAEIDLGRWLKEDYRVPTDDPVEKFEEEPEN